MTTTAVTTTHDSRVFNRAQIATIKKTVARGLLDEEFDQFLLMCRAKRLDPLQRQIYAIVAEGKKGRSVAFITGIDGYRSIASRCGDYRPGNREVVCREELKDPKSNPLGIEYARASVWKNVKDEWHEYVETAYWDEFAPLREIGEGKNNKFHGTGEFELDPRKQNWRKMGRVMLMKCAEAVALRRGWPEDYAGLYEESEMDRMVTDLTPSAEAHQAEVEERLQKIGAADKSMMTISLPGVQELQVIPIGKAHDMLSGWIREHKDEPSTIMQLEEINRQSFRMWWASDPDSVLDIRKQINAIKEQMDNDDRQPSGQHHNGQGDGEDAARQ